MYWQWQSITPTGFIGLYFIFSRYLKQHASTNEAGFLNAGLFLVKKNKWKTIQTESLPLFPEIIFCHLVSWTTPSQPPWWCWSLSVSSSSRTSLRPTYLLSSCSSCSTGTFRQTSPTSLHSVLSHPPGYTDFFWSVCLNIVMSHSFTKDNSYQHVSLDSD